MKSPRNVVKRVSSRCACDDCADATVLDAGLLFEIGSDMTFNVSSLLRFNFGSFAVSRAVVDACPKLDFSNSYHNLLAVRFTHILLNSTFGGTLFVLAVCASD